MTATKKELVLDLFNSMEVVRPRDVEAIGVSGSYLNLLFRQGVLDRPHRGLYTLPEAEPTEFRSIVEACKLSPNSTVCLLSALRVHDLTTQSPYEVWLAIGEKDRKPQISYPPIRVVRFSGAARTFGVEQHELEGIPVTVYSPAKTVADCFKYRNKIGLDVAIEALRDCRRTRKATNDQLWKAANACRMANVMRPYLEATS
ncbi:type IV toxin-antitoxin system AbiEi family antitoxin domain-containing protein [Stieleria bergensis]|uniref:type IV toxin-antitoxin system AbiEi family antitoxin domain-containing protein n=1 Tax=Stieleria bergensis TaxID=2528025 RepID=UPI003AF3A4B7